MHEGRRCPNCHNTDALVPVESVFRYVPSSDGEGRKVEVAAFRCVYCGVADLVKRDAARTHESEQPVPEQPFWTDGLIYATRPPTEEVT